MNEFPKNLGMTYRILDDEAYERFWCGKKPSTRKLYEEWLHNPKESMYTVCMRHGKTSRVLLTMTNMELRKQGIMDRVKTEAPRMKVRKITLYECTCEVCGDTWTTHHPMKVCPVCN